MVTGSNFSSNRRDVEAVLKPDPRRFAARIIGWIVCWPWDLLGELIVNNPFKLIFGIAATEVRAAFDEITYGEFRDIERDLELDEPRESKPAVESQLPVTVATERLSAASPALYPVTAPNSIALQSAPLQTAQGTVPHAVSSVTFYDPAATPLGTPSHSAVTNPASANDPWLTPRQPASVAEPTATPTVPVWTPPQIRMFGQPSSN